MQRTQIVFTKYSWNIHGIISCNWNSLLGIDMCFEGKINHPSSADNQAYIIFKGVLCG